MRVECRTVLHRVARCADGSTGHSDEELDACARAGDVEAFGELVERYSHAVYHLIRSRLRDPFETERLVIEVFCAAWRDLQHPHRRHCGFLNVLSHAIAGSLADLDPPRAPQP